MSPGDRMAKGLDFMLKGISPKDKTPESGETLQESGVTTQESRVGRQEPGSEVQDPKIMSRESGVTTPDKMQDASVAHQESSVVTPESRNMTQDLAVQTRETKHLSQEETESGINSQELGVVTDDIIELAVAQALKSPKISLYSPLLLAVLESQQLMLLNRKETTLLQYRKATKARELVENALRESYPELCEKILKQIDRKP